MYIQTDQNTHLPSLVKSAVACDEAICCKRVWVRYCLHMVQILKISKCKQRTHETEEIESVSAC